MTGREALGGGRRQGLGQPARHQQRWEDPVGERTQLLDRVLEVALDLVDHGDGIRGVVLDRIAGQPQLHGQGDQVLLGAVVEVALELAPLGVSCRHDAGP